MTRSFQSAALKSSVDVRAGVRGALSPSWKKVEYLVCAFGPSPLSVIHLQIIQQFSQCMCRNGRERGKRVQSGLELSPCRKKSSGLKKTEERLKRSVHARHRSGPSGGLTSARSVCESGSWPIPAATETSHGFNIQYK